MKDLRKSLFKRLRPWLAGLAVCALCAGVANAQLLGGRGGGLPPLGAGPLAHGVTGTLDQTTRGLGNTLDNTIGSTLRVVTDTVGRPRATTRVFEKDPLGARVVRGEILAIAPNEQSLATARDLNFQIARQEKMSSLGLTVVVLTVPEDMSASDALAALRNADPGGSYDYDHIYDPSGASSSASSNLESGGSVPGAAKIGILDAGVDRNHPAFENSKIVAKNFGSDGDSPPTAHGTAVASLLVGDDDDFHGALRGTTLYAADVYGGQAAGGSANDIARGLAWLAANNVPVANVSLAGPPNALLAAAVAAFVKRGHVLVAAVGNDGPAAPAKYPAAYPGVIGVTSVDAERNVQLDANQGDDVVFAARGVDVRAAAPKGHYQSITGTSFAAPFVAARFALMMNKPDANVAQAMNALQHDAIDLGAPGRDPIFGYGFLDSPGAAALTAKAAR